MILLDVRGREMTSTRQPQFGSKIEKEYFYLARLAYDANHPNVSVSHNEILYGFESDLVIRIYSAKASSAEAPSVKAHSGGEPQVVINVELDGPHHKAKNKRQFCMLRDLHLRERGVSVLRLDLTSKRQQGKLQAEIIEDFITLVAFYTQVPFGPT
jgi:hypothetical protein